uniref:Macaca fascicularis brain cDNA, clone: QflA-17947 n=1 Tax=Macaca fascicularis TaxID=9541 RepID=I7GI87_MACFA|nr:unnamed protein product [Macaca fascicularis]
MLHEIVFTPFIYSFLTSDRTYLEISFAASLPTSPNHPSFSKAGVPYLGSLSFPEFDTQRSLFLKTDQKRCSKGHSLSHQHRFFKDLH